MSSAICERAPSAPTRNRARWVKIGVRDPVVQGHGDAVGVLGVAEVLGVEGDLRAALGGVGDQHRLHQRLRHVQHGAGAALQVVTAPVVAGAPGLQPGDLGAAEAGGEQGVPHLLPRGGLQFGGLLDAQVPQHLDGPLVDDVRPGGVRHPVPLGHHVHPHPVGGQRQRGGAAHGTGSHDNDVGVEFARCVHDSFLPFYGCRFREGSEVAGWNGSGWVRAGRLAGGGLLRWVFQLPGGFLAAPGAGQQQQRDDGDRRGGQQVDDQAVGGAGGAVERDGDQRGERGTADLGEGVADRDPGVADLGAEHQGEQRSGGAAGRGHRDTEDQHQGQGEQPRVAGVDQGDRRARPRRPWRRRRSCRWSCGRSGPTANRRTRTGTPRRCRRRTRRAGRRCGSA